MRKLLVLALTLTLVGSAMAFDLGNQAGDKPVVNYPQNIPGDRQGGDTIADAVVVPLPVIDGTGTTAGYIDDYDEVCPYGNSTSPDVVYTFTPAIDMARGHRPARLEPTTPRSTSTTRTWPWSPATTTSTPTTSRRSRTSPCWAASSTSSSSTATAATSATTSSTSATFEPCALDCPAGAELEGEPPLVDDYEDAYNGGCNSPEFGNPFSTIASAIFCGVTGWYLNGGIETRDTDWFEHRGPAERLPRDHRRRRASHLHVRARSAGLRQRGRAPERDHRPLHRGHHDHPGRARLHGLVLGRPDHLHRARERVRLRAVLDLEGSVATEDHSWTGVKALFD